MCDSKKTKKMLVEELQALRSRLAELERIEAERKGTEEALRESEQCYARAAQIGHFGHWERSLADDKATWSDESCRIFGVDPSKFEPSLDNFLSLVNPSDREPLNDAIQAAISRGKPMDIEYRIVRPDGAERILHSVAEVRVDKNGQPVKLVGTAHDITEQKQAEEALRKAHDQLEAKVEERTAALARANALLKEQIAERERVEQMLSLKNTAMESSIEAIAFVDVEGSLTYVNNSFLKMWGYSEQKQILGKRAVQFWADVDRAAEIREIVHNKGSWVGELLARKKDGSTFDAQLSASLIRDEAGNPVCIMASFVDVTERKKAEATVASQKALLDNVISNIPAFVFWKDKHSVYLGCNDDFAKLAGLKNPADVVGKTDYDLPWKKSESDFYRRIDKEVVTTRAPQLNVEESVHLTDGTAATILTSKVPLRNADGVVEGILGVFLDITERKKAEEELDKFKRMADLATHGCATADLEGNITYVNGTFASMHGYTPGELIGKNLRMFHTKAQMSRVNQINRRLLETGQGIQGEEVWHVRRDGTEFSTLMSNWVLKDANGKPILICGTAIDITDRKRADQDLIQSEEKYRSVVENIGIGVSLISPRMEILALNNQLKKWFPDVDVSKKPICYKTFNNPAREHICSYCPTCKSLKDGQVHDSVTETPAGDKITNYRIVSSPIKDKDGNIIAAVEMVEDITEQKKAEQALRESEERYKALFEGAVEGILVADVETKQFTYVNPAACGMLGYTEQELTQMGVRDIHPQADLESVIADFEAQARGQKTLATNIPCLRKDGAMMYADIDATKVVIDGRECNVGFFTDITERKKAEDELEKAHDELEMRVEQRTADLARAIEELRSEIAERKKAERKLLTSQKQLRSLASELSLAEERLRRRMATDVHDHISQNLAISKIKLESLRKSVSPTELAGALDEIGELMARAIESSRSLTFELSPPVLYELGFEAAVEWLVRQTRQQHGLTTEFEDDGRPKPLEHDVRVLLFQAVRELLVNVAKHAQAHSVTVSVRRVGDQIQVSVEDDGVGFDTSEVGSRDYKTGGFGLFSIRERLGGIGGRLDIESSHGRGTRIAVVAPIDHKSQQRRERPT